MQNWSRSAAPLPLAQPHPTSSNFVFSDTVNGVTGTPSSCGLTPSGLSCTGQLNGPIPTAATFPKTSFQDSCFLVRHEL